MGLPNGTTGTVGTMGKPPPGRDPKSRARSRDYLKQFVSSYTSLPSGLIVGLQMSPGNLVFDVSASRKPAPKPAAPQQHDASSPAPQRSL